MNPLLTGSELFQNSWVSETITVINGEKRIGQSVTVNAYPYKKICDRGVPPHNYGGGVQLHLLNFGKEHKQFFVETKVFIEISDSNLTFPMEPLREKCLTCQL